MSVVCSCGATLPPAGSTVTHRYIISTPECWACFTGVLAREYGSPSLFAEVHQLTVDAYAAQHPVHQPAKSVAAHLVSLFSIIEAGKNGTGAIKSFVESRRDFPSLDPPASFGALTIADVAGTQDAGEHRDMVRRWAHEVWASWSTHHEQIAHLAGASEP